jgi:hypothetical protein
MACVPKANVLRVRLAALPLTGTVPRVFAPSLKVMLPLEFPPNWGVMVAVNVMDWLNTDGLTVEATAVVVVA